MELKIYPLSPEKLMSIPAKERALAILLAHALNELNVINKLLFLCNKFPDEPKWTVHAHSCQGLVLIRTLLGKLNEAWNVVTKGYFGTKLVFAYKDNLDSSSSAALKSLSKYFGSKNAINKIRNDFSFHYWLEIAEAVDFSGSDDEDLSLYLGETNGNTLYQFAEYAMNKALMDKINPSYSPEVFEKIMSETGLVVHWFNLFTQDLLACIIARHTEDPSPLQIIDIGDVPNAETIHIPFYFQSTNNSAQV